MAPRQGRQGQLEGQFPLPEKLPGLLAADGVNAPHAALAPFAPLGHALGRLQAVEVVGVNPPVANTDAFLERRVEGNIQRRYAPRDGKR